MCCYYGCCCCYWLWCIIQEASECAGKKNVRYRTRVCLLLTACPALSHSGIVEVQSSRLRSIYIYCLGKHHPAVDSIRLFPPSLTPPTDITPSWRYHPSYILFAILTRRRQTWLRLRFHKFTMTLQYAPFQSEIELPFYSALSNLKIDHDRLDVSARQVLGLYGAPINPTSRTSCQMQILGNALTSSS